MKCKKCNEENITTANYCKKCGNPFTDEERKEAYDKTIYGKIDFIKNLQGYLDLSFITGNQYFRIGVLVLIVVYIIFTGGKGKELRIEKSEQYEVQYNETLNEYYLISDESNIALQLYLPEEPLTIDIVSYNAENEVNNSRTFKPEDEMIVETSTQQYYIVTANYEKGSQDLKFFVINEE